MRVLYNPIPKFDILPCLKAGDSCGVQAATVRHADHDFLDAPPARCSNDSTIGPH